MAPLFNEIGKHNPKKTISENPAGTKKAPPNGEAFCSRLLAGCFNDLACRSWEDATREGHSHDIGG